MLLIPSADAQRLPVACLLERSLAVKTIPEEYRTHVAPTAIPAFLAIAFLGYLAIR
jgi:hypothetical protein